MLESLLFVLFLSSLLGFLSGIGIGGGSLLILWLTLVLEVPAETARGMNLLFFIPSALIACCFRQKQGSLEIKPLIPAILAGCTAAAVFSWISNRISVELLKKGFGILLLIAGTRELLYRPRKPR